MLAEKDMVVSIMSEKTDFIIATVDLYLSSGFPPAVALTRAMEDYAYVYHSDNDKTELARAAERALLVEEYVPSKPVQTLYQKYEIVKKGGEPVDPEGQYFVLRIDTDYAARVALLVYANHLEGTAGSEFANQLRDWVKQFSKDSSTD